MPLNVQTSWFSGFSRWTWCDVTCLSCGKKLKIYVCNLSKISIYNKIQKSRKAIHRPIYYVLESANHVINLFIGQREADDLQSAFLFVRLFVQS